MSTGTFFLFALSPFLSLPLLLSPRSPSLAPEGAEEARVPSHQLYRLRTGTSVREPLMPDCSKHGKSKLAGALTFIIALKTAKIKKTPKHLSAGQTLEIFTYTKASLAKSFACQVFECRLTLQWVTALRRHLAADELGVM